MNGILKDSAKLLTANVVAQVVGLAVYPLLTRLYSPGDFGLLNLFLSIAGVIVLIATAEYQYAIVLPKDDNKSRAVVHIALMLVAVVTMIMLLSLPFSQWIAAQFDALELARWWWLMPVYVLLVGFWNVISYIYIRKTQFSRISGYQISQSVVSAGSKVGFGYLGFLNGGLLVSTIIGPFVALVGTVVIAWRKCLKAFAVPCSKAEYIAAAREYSNFPKFNLPRALVNSVGLAIPVWLLTSNFGVEQVGMLSLALLAAFVPLNIIARACYQVLYQRVTDLVQQRLSISRLMWRFCLYMAGGLVVGMTVVYFFVPQLVTVLFGAQWIESAAIIHNLYPALVFVPICGSICFLSDVFTKQKTAMWMEISYVLVMTIALELGIQTGSFLISVSAYAWAGFGYMLIQLLWFSSLIYRYERTL